jgi:nicotinate-nucleotide--dimethylbenzimidazole phosphoribosyltransferase
MGKEGAGNGGTKREEEQEERHMELETRLKEVVEKIKPLDESAMEASWKHWDSLCKPLRAMGMLEDMIVQLAGIYGNPRPKLEKSAVVVMGADNGVVAQGVTQTGSEVTAQVLENMGDHLSSVCIMASLHGTEVIPVNVGMLVDGKHPRIINRPVRYGTANMAKGPAMSRQEALEGIFVGIETVEELYRQGYRMFFTGEMGIGNTTTSSACAAVLLEQPVEVMTGRGAGLSSEGLKKKIAAIHQAIAVNQPDRRDVLDVLAKVGGLDIAGMIGCYIGAASLRTPVIMDGFISSVAAYMASLLAPAAKAYMVPSHCSAEPAGQLMLDALGMKAPLHAGMRLGEGTGGVTLLSLYQYALAIYDRMPSFAQGNVEEYTHQK